MNDVLFTKEDSTILKGIAICLMVYYHVAACGNMIHNSLLLTIWFRLGNFCVPMFAFLSAFGIARNYCSRANPYTINIEYLKHRCKALYIPYLMNWIICALGMLIFTPGYIASRYPLSWPVVMLPVLLDMSGLSYLLFDAGVYTLCTTWWYMPVAWFIIFSTILLITYFQGSKDMIVMMSASIFINIILIYFGMRPPIYIAYTPMICVSVFLVKFCDNYKFKFFHVLLSVLVVVTMLFCRLYFPGSYFVNLFDAFAVIPICIMLIKIAPRQIYTPLRFLGKYSSGIFLVHSFVYLYFPYTSKLTHLVRNSLFTFIFTIILSLLYSLYLSKISSFAIRKLP